MRVDTRHDGLWSWSQGCWRSGPSWVAPYDHPALETHCWRDTTRVAFQVRERLPGQTLGTAATFPRPVGTSTYEATREAAQQHEAAHHIIEIARGSVTVTAGGRVTAPVYLTVEDGVLHAHWDFTEVASQRTSHALDRVETARLLHLAGIYSTRTLYRDVHLLTERRTARFHDQTLTFTEPGNNEHPLPRELADGADVVAAYVDLLDGILGDHFHQPESTAVELSGGMDSANVALSLYHRHGAGLRAGALVHEGEAGEQQLRRRSAIKRHCGIRDDLTIRAADHSPLDRRWWNEERPGPHEELYIAGHSRLLAGWREEGVRWAATGVGGDEMLSLVPTTVGDGEHQRGTPLPGWFTPRTRESLRDRSYGVPSVPPISDSTLRAVTCGAPMYLRAGVWPLYPLADPAAFLFGQWLPATWRRDKRLARTRVRTANPSFPREVSHPRLRENFHPVWEASVRRFAPQLTRSLIREGSPLIDEGYVDADALAAAADRIEDGTARSEDGAIGHTLRLHRALT
ncbi:hypothetical protein [Streptomyces sp. NPDC049906]|uniref:hypothetical protein n=1 Tax=Streptomyces sp. NPDC049906 TaxID=3155656 RepID=UPI003433C6FE